MQWLGTLLGFLASHCHCFFYHKIDMTATSWQVLPGCQSHIHQMFRSKTCIKNDHDRFSGFHDLDGFWKKKHLPMTWMLMAHHDWKITETANLKVLVAPGEWAKLFVDWVEPPRGWVKWAKTAESKGNMDLKETQKWWRWRWWRWICWRRGSGTHLLMEQNSTTICLYVYSRVTCLIYRL